MSSQSDYINKHLRFMGFSSKADIIENLYLKSLIDSYSRIEQTISKENEIRDRFMYDLYHTDSELKPWLQNKYIFLDWENWKFTPEFKLARADISFKFFGFEFIIECKRLKSPDRQYFDEGLNRFITLHYGMGDEYAGMIGFIINDKDDYIFEGLRSKVKEYDYIKTDFSKSNYSGISSSFLSSHTRTDRTPINIYHLLFSFSKMA